LAEFFLLWTTLTGVHLDPERDDVLVWRLTSDGVFMAKSAYNAFFAGTTFAPVHEKIWRSRTP
jgi:hypothetical protein